ncbi:MAG: chromate transporter [Thermodesulfobacteriota bacterium]
MTLLTVLWVFGALSVMAVGGGTAVLPEMKALTVNEYHWLNADQFGQVYSLGQLAPGPNMLMVSVIGYRVAGFPGALAAIVGFFLPAGLIMFFCGRIWDRFAESPWKVAVQRGLAPLTIGLMLAGTWVLARTVILGPMTALIAVVVTVVLLVKHVNPALLIFGGGIASWLLGR